MLEEGVKYLAILREIEDGRTPSLATARPQFNDSLSLKVSDIVKKGTQHRNGCCRMYEQQCLISHWNQRALERPLFSEEEVTVPS